MFKDLKLLKIVLILILAIIIVKNQLAGHKSTDFIFNLTAYNNSGSLSFHSISNVESRATPFLIKNVVTNKTVLDTLINVSKTYDYFDSLDFLVTGYSKNQIKINKFNFQPGIYSVNNKNPFVVSKNSKSDVTIVFPGANNLFYTPQNGKRIFEIDSTFISSNLPYKVDEWTKGMASFFSRVEETHDVNYITDLDLENYNFLLNTKLLVLYGRLTFWSPLMIKNIEEFIQNGGNVLIASSDVFYAKFCYDRELKRLKVNFCGSFLSSQAGRIQSWNEIMSDTNIYAMRYAFHSNYGGINIDRKGVAFEKRNHPILNGIKLPELSLALDVGSQYLGTLNVEKNSETYNKLRLDRISIIAKTYCKIGSKIDNTGGVFEFRKDNGGKAIVIGSSDLCLKESQNKSTVFKLFLNSLNYLLDS